MKAVFGIVVSMLYLSALLVSMPFVILAKNHVEALFVNTEILMLMFGILFFSDEKYSNSSFLETLQVGVLFVVVRKGIIVVPLHEKYIFARLTDQPLL